MQTPQIALNLKIQEEIDFNHYYIGNNKQLVVTLHTIAGGRGEYFVYIWGTKGAGKTHLLQSCYHAADKIGLTTVYLSLSKPNELKPNILENLESLNIVCIDDIQGIVGHPKWEEAFFDCFNRLQNAGKRLIVSSTRSPHDLGLSLPDLISRLSSGAVFNMRELSDDQKLQALIERANKAGLTLSKGVALFLLHRLPRNMGALFRALAKLDQSSLESQRKLTIPFVKSVLNI